MLTEINNMRNNFQIGGGIASSYSSNNSIKAKLNNVLARLHYIALKSVLILSTLFFVAIKCRKVVA